VICEPIKFTIGEDLNVVKKLILRLEFHGHYVERGATICSSLREENLNEDVHVMIAEVGFLSAVSILESCSHTNH